MRPNNTVKQLTKEIERSKIPNILNNRNKRFIFPMEVYAGNVNNTEMGEIADFVKPSSFTQYQKIFTGQDTILTRWKGSTSISKENETDDYFTIKFEPGEALSVHIDSINASLETAPTGDDAEFATQQANVRISCILEGETLGYDDLFNFYVAPSTGTKTYFEIEQLITYVDITDKEILLTEIILSSVNDKLASSGQSLEQWIQKAEPGAGYAWPKENANEHTWEIDIDKTQNNPITSVQIEVFGGGITTAPIIMGRRKNGKDDKKIEAPKHLAPYRMLIPQASQTSKTVAGSNNFYFIAEANIDVVSFYGDWQEKMRGNYDLTSKGNYEGIIDTDPDTVKATNDPNENGGRYRDIYDEEWLINAGDLTISGSAIGITENIIKITGMKTVPELLTAGMFAFLDTEKLPISTKETISWSSKDIPIIGGFLNIASLGIPWGWEATTNFIQAKAIFGFIPAELYEFSSIALGDTETTKGKLPLDIFRNDTDDEVSGAIGSNQISQTFHFAITDTFTRLNEGGEAELLNTRELGQKEENGGWKYSGAEIPTDPLLSQDEGFVIDIIGYKGVVKSDYKITFFRNGNPVFQVKQQTRSKFTGSVLEWTNINKTSNLEALNGEQVEYPERVPDKEPISGYDNLTFKIESSNVGEITYDLETYGLTWEQAIQAYTTIDLNHGEGVMEYGTDVSKEIDTNTYSISLQSLSVENTEVLIKDYTANGDCEVRTIYYRYARGECNRYNCFSTQNLSASNGVWVKRVGNKITIKHAVSSQQGTKCSTSSSQCNSEYIATSWKNTLYIKDLVIRN